jgi:hypothetical protein
MLGLSATQSIQILSVVVGVTGVILGYFQYKSATMGDAYSREQIMRERYSEMKKEWDLKKDGILKISVPRVRPLGYKQWLKSMLPGGDYPGYTHFNIKFNYPQYPDPFDPPRQDMREVAEDFTDPPSPKELEENEKLRELGVQRVVMQKEPAVDGSGDFKLNPNTEYRVFLSTADPDRVESAMDMFHYIVDEMQTDEEIVTVTDQMGLLDKIVSNKQMVFEG